MRNQTSCPSRVFSSLGLPVLSSINVFHRSEFESCVPIGSSLASPSALWYSVSADMLLI